MTRQERGWTAPAVGSEHDNVIAISTRLNESPPVEVLRERYDSCRHEHTVLNQRLHTVDCRDCGQERLDPFEVLVHLASTWSRWHHEAESLRKLRADERAASLAAWERARDRHIGANPGHVVDPYRTSWAGDKCRICTSLEHRGSTVVPRKADAIRNGR